MMTLGLCKVNKEDKVGAGPQAMASVSIPLFFFLFLFAIAMCSLNRMVHMLTPLLVSDYSSATVWFWMIYLFQFMVPMPV